MISCPFCQTIHVDNTLFCSECGTYLLEEEKRDTFPLETDEEESGSFLLNVQTNIVDDTDVIFPPNTMSLPQLRLTIPSQQKTLELALEKPVYLGRLDPAANVYPEIDLTDSEGLEHGVSRQHLRIIPREGKIFAEDLGAINGSQLNGQRLNAYLPEPLHDGDVLQLGTLTVEVHFVARSK